MDIPKSSLSSLLLSRCSFSRLSDARRLTPECAGNSRRWCCCRCKVAIVGDLKMESVPLWTFIPAPSQRRDCSSSFGGMPNQRRALITIRKFTKFPQLIHTHCPRLRNATSMRVHAGNRGHSKSCWTWVAFSFDSYHQPASHQYHSSSSLSQVGHTWSTASTFSFKVTRQRFRKALDDDEHDAGSA